MSDNSNQEKPDPYDEVSILILIEFLMTEGGLQPVSALDWFDRDKIIRI